MRTLSKRPLSVLCLFFIAGLWMLELMGVTRDGAPGFSAKSLTQIDQSQRYEVRGELYRSDVKDDTIYLYLKSAILIRSDQKNSNQRRQQHRKQNQQKDREVQLGKVRVRILKHDDMKSVLKASECEIGDRLSASGRLYEMESATNPGQFDTAAYYRRQGIFTFLKAERITVISRKKVSLKRELEHIRNSQRMLLTEMAPEASGVLAAMLLGDQSLLDEETKSAYQISGILHVLAISGTHLSLLAAGIMRILLKTGLSRRLSGGVAAAMMIGYGIFTGNGISTVRAVLMFALAAGAIAWGRSYDLMTAVSLSAVLILAEKPGFLYDGGFLLSFSAVLGIAILLPEMPERSGGMAVFLSQLPIVQGLFFQVSIFSMLINLAVLPLLPIVLGSGLIGLTAGNLSVRAGSLLLFPAKQILLLYEGSGVLLKQIPAAVWITGSPTPWQIAVYYAILAAGIVFGKKRVKRWIGISAAAILILTIRPPQGFSLTMLDVGQGDCFVLQTPFGGSYLIDGGSSSVSEVGRYRILPCLKYRGIRKLDGIFITHGDADHINGIEELLKEIEEKKTALCVERLLLPIWMKGKEGEIGEAAKKAGIALVYLKQGDVIRDGETEISVLEPEWGFEPEDENSGSLAMKVSYHGYKILMTGDLSGRGEERVKRQDLACDILKVAHHGSDYSTDEVFLEKAGCGTALISCGKNNRYGHPGKKLMSRLQKRGITIFDTRRAGAVTIRIGKQIKIYTECEQKIGKP